MYIARARYERVIRVAAPRRAVELTFRLMLVLLEKAATLGKSEATSYETLQRLMCAIFSRGLFCCL